MSTAAVPEVTSRAERRRSKRLPLALHVTVRGTSLGAKPFQEDVCTLSVNAHGALLLMGTTVTLGQGLFLINPNSAEEVGCWVSRFGLPRGGLAQVGVELVRPNAEFWSAQGPAAQPEANGAGEASDPPPESDGRSGIHLLPGPSAAPDAAVAVPAAAQANKMAFEARQAGAEGYAAAALPDALLHALGDTLQHAANEAVAAAAAERLGGAVNRAAEAIENFSTARIRQLQDRLEQLRAELVDAALEESLARLETRLGQAEEKLRQSLEGLLADAARSFAEARGAAAGEIEQAVADERRRVEALAAVREQTFGECEARVRGFQDEFRQAGREELERFRGELRGVLAALSNSLSPKPEAED